MLLSHGEVWMDTCTLSNKLKTTEFVEVMQENQGFYVSCIKELPGGLVFIAMEQLTALG